MREDNDLARVLRLPPVVWVGTVSYGMYLFHMVAVNLVRRAAGAAGMSSPYVDFVGGAVLAIALATASYLTYERFFLGLKERWFAGKRVAAPRRQPVGALGVGGTLRPDAGREPSAGA